MNILVKPFKGEIEEKIYELCTQNEWHPLALEIMPNHIHFFISTIIDNMDIQFIIDTYQSGGTSSYSP